MAGDHRQGYDLLAGNDIGVDLNRVWERFQPYLIFVGR